MHNADIHNLYSSQDIGDVIKEKQMNGNMTRIGEIRNEYRSCNTCREVTTREA